MQVDTAIIDVVERKQLLQYGDMKRMEANRLPMKV